MTEDNNENSNIIKGGFKFTDIYKYLNDSDTHSLQNYLDANEIQNHAQLEPIFLLTWNTSLAMKIFKGLIDDSLKKMNESIYLFIFCINLYTAKHNQGVILLGSLGNKEAFLIFFKAQ